MPKEAVLVLRNLIELCEIGATEFKYRPLHRDLVDWKGISPASFATKAEAIQHFVENLPKMFTSGVRVDAEGIRTIRLELLPPSAKAVYNGHCLLRCRRRSYKVLPN